MTAIFAKTRKGQDEIETRSCGLGPRARRLLILFDGKRPLDEVRALMPDPKLDETLEQLRQDAFIELIGEAADSPAGAAPAPAVAPAAPQPAEVAPAADGNTATVATEPKKLEMARNFMINSLRTFNGPYGSLDLMTRINDSRSSSDLHELVEDWFHAISLTKMGKLRAVELKSRLLAVL